MNVARNEIRDRIESMRHEIDRVRNGNEEIIKILAEHQQRKHNDLADRYVSRVHVNKPKLVFYPGGGTKI